MATDSLHGYSIGFYRVQGLGFRVCSLNQHLGLKMKLVGQDSCQCGTRQVVEARGKT